MSIGKPAEIALALKALFPKSVATLNYASHFQLLVAIVLSAQATDASVNKATKELFRLYPDARSMSLASPKDIEPLISSIGLAPTKARRIILLARALKDGAIPNEKEALMALPGVGNKTAGVYLIETGLGKAFPVDTHVGRIARRLGLSQENDPTKVEADLERIFPEEEWRDLHHRFLSLGRTICRARDPLCASCPLRKECAKRLSALAQEDKSTESA